MATITKEKAAELTAKFGANEKDTGNVRVQIAILTEKIKTSPNTSRPTRRTSTLSAVCP